MSLETFEAGYAGARPPRTGAQWSGMWKLEQTTDRLIDGKWPSPWSVAGGNQTKSFAIVPGDGTPLDVQFNDDGTKFYILGDAKDTIFQYTCATAWDVNTASYAGKSFYIGTQETQPSGLFFKSDGTKFYIVGYTNKIVYQYLCATAWDVSTASYENKLFSVTTQEPFPNGLFFKPDGLKFYIVGTSGVVYQYSCATAWDISTASYDTKSFSVAAQETFPNGLFFKPDGLKFYIVGSTNDTVYQYSCATAWDVSTASYDTKSFSVTAQDTIPTGLFFKSDGTTFYIVGNTNDTVFQYACATAWDVSTASYNSKAFFVGAGQETIPTDVQFNNDGTKFYVIGTINDTIYQYSCATAWDVSTASYENKSFSVTTQETQPGGLFFKPDGLKFYIVGGTNDTVYQYSCATAWDINTGSYDSKSFSISAQETNPSGLFFKPDGTTFYIVGSGNDTVYQYSCATAWDVSTASYATKSFSVGTQETEPRGLFFKSDGTTFYIVGLTNDTVYQYSCATAWDVSTASYATKSFSVATQDTTPNGLVFKPDGTKFYILGTANDTIYQYSCATAWEMNATSTYDSKSFNVNAQDTNPADVQFKDDGTKFYILGDTNNTVYQYSCATSWDVSTASYDTKSFSVASQETNPNGLFFKSDGTKFYIVGGINRTVYQYSCATAWDISTGSYDTKSFSVASQETNPNGLFFKSDGTKFYIVGSTNNTIYQYSCATAWDVSTASYDSKLFSLTPVGETSATALFFKSDGTKFYVIGYGNDRVFQFSCATAWDIGTASYDNRFFSVSGLETNPHGLFFKSDGTKFYIVGQTNDNVYQYSTVAAWEIQSPFYDNKLFRTVTEEATPGGLTFKADGTKFYVIGNTYDTVFQYSCSTAWDISTGSYDNKAFSVLAQEGTPTALVFKPDGTKLYVIGANDTVFQYSCATAWDVSTASYDSRSFSATTLENQAEGLFFKPDGTKFYVVGGTNDTVFQFACGTAWDISTAYYETKSFTIRAQEATPLGLCFKDDGTKFYTLGSTNDSVYQYVCTTPWDLSTASYDGVAYSVSTQDTTGNEIQFKSDGTTFYVLGDSTDTIYQYSCLLQ
jgi:sugar lactone lactonase YvrE